MDFLKEILGEELFAQFAEKVNAHNGNDANKDKQIKLANLGGGEYVGKAKYEALQALLDGKTMELDTANGLIADLKKSTKGNEEMQGKITGYETQVAQLQKELAETKVKAALKVALLSEKAVDVDYLAWKINEKMAAEGKTLELDENENIKNVDGIMAEIKTQIPTMFENAGKLKVEPNRLPTPTDSAEMSKEDFAKMGYNARVNLRAENPELYKILTEK